MLFPATPFESVALALSGGGFRAATYGLGVLSLLDKVMIPRQDGPDQPLLERVHFMSSASGGTITLSVYAACKSAGMSFNEFYTRFLPQLEGQNLLNNVFAVLENDQNWKAKSTEGKYRNPINAFSLVYHETLFANIPHHLGALRNPKNSSHVQEVCFNAVEFTTGLSFRFQCHQKPANSEARGGDFGNDSIQLEADAWQTLDAIRLADILASSSCFPGGFEPMRYPADFAHENLTVASLQSALRIQPNIGKPVNTLALMDGGICDNQGLDSLLNAFKRTPLQPNRANPKGEAFDLLLVCDVASHFMHPAQFRDPSLPAGIGNKTPDTYWNKIHKIWKMIPSIPNVVLLTGVALLVFVGFYGYRNGWHAPTIVLGILSLLITGGGFAAKRLFNKLKPGASFLEQPDLENMVTRLSPKGGFSIKLGNQLVNYIRRRPIAELSKWVTDRASSISTLLGDIFLKQIRRQIYHKLYSDLQTYYRRVYVPIYSLSHTNDKDRKNPPFDIQGDKETDDAYRSRRAAFRQLHTQHNSFTPEMQRIADTAYSMGTTLWFSPEEEGSDPFSNKRKALVACGQFTAAYELYQYALLLKCSSHFENLSPHYQAVVSSVVQQLSDLMIQFRNDPFWLVKERETVLQNQ